MKKHTFLSLEKKLEKEKELVNNILDNKDLLLEIKKEFDSDYIDDLFYRYYHQSFKVYRIQGYTTKGFEFFVKVSPSISLFDFNKQFLEIYYKGTDKKFHVTVNKRWSYETSPLLEAFFHTKYLINMMVKYVLEGDESKREGSSAWFSVLSI